MDNIRYINNNMFRRRAYNNSHFDSYDFNITNISIKTGIDAILDANILPFLTDKYGYKYPYNLPFCYLENGSGRDEYLNMIYSNIPARIIPYRISGNILTREHVSIFRYNNSLVFPMVSLNDLSDISDITDRIDAVLESLPDGLFIDLQYSKSLSGAHYTTIIDRICEQTCQNTSFITGLLYYPGMTENYGYSIMLYTGLSTGGSISGELNNWYIQICDNINTAVTLHNNTDGVLYLYSVNLCTFCEEYNNLQQNCSVNSARSIDILSSAHADINLIYGLMYR